MIYKLIKSKNKKQDLLGLIRLAYHRLPLTHERKLKLRQFLSPYLNLILGIVDGNARISLQNFKNNSASLDWGGRREYLLGRALVNIFLRKTSDRSISSMIVLPFLSVGGAERVALNFCRALVENECNQGVLLVVADKILINNKVQLPAGVTLLVLDEFVDDDLVITSADKMRLLEDLVVAIQPRVFHNINSEIAWHLIIERGANLNLYTKLFASIFAFQFAGEGKQKIGYAEYFLKKGLPHLSALLSDNSRFLLDASIEYRLSDIEKSKLHVVYNPSRVDFINVESSNKERLNKLVTSKCDRRLKVLWAGRLDAEKRIDLLFQVVQAAAFADFDIYGQTVVDEMNNVPALHNARYMGGFLDPVDLIKDQSYDVFLFTSKWEGLPNILIEIGSLAVPIIAPTVGGVGELVKMNTGYPLPEVPCVADYVEALLEIQSNPKNAEEKAVNMLCHIRERHSWESFCKDASLIPHYFAD